VYGTAPWLETYDVSPWSRGAERPAAGIGKRWLDVYDTSWVALRWGTVHYPVWVYAVLHVLGLAAAAVAARVRMLEPRPRP
jgi:hypothetical protein